MNQADLSSSAAASLPQPAPRWRAVVETLLIFGVFFLHGAWPVPDVNEAHYLSKAKHYWNPTWCQSDFFVNTADAHQVFYWTFGWVTRYLPLEQVAWVGRLATWALLAWSWRRLSWEVLPCAWLAVLSAELFVMLNENAHMAGEWVVGGVEAKGFAYALVFLGFEAVVRGRWNRAWLFLGAASSLHVIVGGWSTLAAGIAWLAMRFGPAPRPTLRSMLPGLIGGLLLALPGLWCALALSRGAGVVTGPDTDPNQIYVWQRLPHHLAADQFREGYPSRQLVLWALWFVLITVMPLDGGLRRLRWLPTAAIGFSLIGYLLVWLAPWDPAAAASLLSFYWFRMSDVFVPLGVSLVGLSAVLWIAASSRFAARMWLAGLALVSVYDLYGQTAHLPWNFLHGIPQNGAVAVVPRADRTVVYPDWLDVCRWIADPSHTAPTARFITIREASTLRWHADRGEVCSWKDIPQDAASIVEWWQRINDIYGVPNGTGPNRWVDSLAQQGTPRVRELAGKYKADYAIVALLPDVPPLDLPIVYKNASYAVYRLR